jgi:hypothetical protein
MLSNTLVLCAGTDGYVRDFHFESGAVKFQYCPLSFLAEHQQAQILEQKRCAGSSRIVDEADKHLPC